jgi:hypothetical protein
VKKFDIQDHVKSGEVIDLSERWLHRRPAPEIVCVDGFTMSVQASIYHYCEPRDNDGPYTQFEVGYPSEREESLMPFCEDADKPTDTVYGYVPYEVVMDVIEKHGGVR